MIENPDSFRNIGISFFYGDRDWMDRQGIWID